MKLKYMFLNDIDESEVEKFISAAPKNLQDRINKYKQKSDRLRSAIGYMLVENLYCEAFSTIKCPPILFTQKGKPYFENNPVYFSVSHSGDLIVCALNETKIGIDVEEITEFNPKLIDRICSSTEKEYIGASKSKFFEIWTAKEAYSKILGEGLSIGLKNIAIDIENGLAATKKLNVIKVENYIISTVYN